VSAGEIRALVTAGLLAELGFEIAGIRDFHHDKYAGPECEKLAGPLSLPEENQGVTLNFLLDIIPDAS
jgi:hypothetical protein